MIRAEEAQVLLLDKLLEEIRNVKSELNDQKELITDQTKLIMMQIPEGIVEPLNIVHVTDQRRVIQSPMRKNWFSVSIVNDGPDPCWIIVNSEKSTTSPYLLRMNEPTEVEMGTAKIVDIVCHCDSGQEASLRIRGVR
jgi:hypothetical protein